MLFLFICVPSSSRPKRRFVIDAHERDGWRVVER
jgi:hypothetical protein